jgi:hypothetical protein
MSNEGNKKAASATPRARGPVSGYLIDAGMISPDEAQVEAITYSAFIDTAGNITAQTASTRVTPGYVFLLDSIIGAVSDPSVDADVLDLVSFNVKNQGRNMAVFKTPIPMSILASPSGPAHELEWRGAYRFFESADISVDWSVDQTRYAAAAPAAEKRFYVTIMGDIVHESLVRKQ